MNLRIGDRVKVKPHWNFPDGGIGKICAPVGFPDGLDDSDIYDGCARIVPGRAGPIAMVYLEFEAAIKDGDGDGPYSGGEVEVEYVQHL